MENAPDPPSPLEGNHPFRVAFEHAPIGMAILSADGRLTRANPALCRILGRGAHELHDLMSKDLTHPDDLARNDDHFRELIAGRADSFQIEKRYRHSQGHYVWVSFSASPVRDHQGAIRYFIVQVQDVSERKKAEVELEHVADHDWLTGLLNRRGFQRRLEGHIARARAGGPAAALMILDLDDFKYVNDTLGHHAGDRLITTVASILRTRLRECDLLARLGGDEFAVLLPDCGGPSAVAVADELLRTLRATPTIPDARAHRLTASVGVAELDGSHADADAALAQADLAMYVAKEAGRDGVSLWSEGSGPQRRLVERMEWVRRIEHALHSGGFQMHAQPIRNVRSGRVEHHELLIRMRDDALGLVEPGDFLDTAERFDLIRQIDHFAVDEAMRLVKHGLRGTCVAVNLSGRSIGDGNLLEVLERHAPLIPGGPGRVMFEITETAAVADLSDAARFTQDLRRIGFKVALDDFGQGFGSFAYLKHLDFDVLKIDGEFVRGCAANLTDRLIIEAVVRIARGLDVQTIAECVESAETALLMARLGVDHCQGYAVGYPVPADLVLAPAEEAADPNARATRSAQRRPVLSVPDCG